MTGGGKAVAVALGARWPIAGGWRGRRGGRSGRATGAPGLTGAPHQRTQIHLGHHAMLHQRGVGVLAGLLERLGQRVLHRLMRQRPHFARQADGDPLIDHDARQHIRAQDVLRRQLLRALDALHAQAQVVPGVGNLVGQAQHQARGKDLVLDHVVVDQRQGTDGGKAGGAADGVRGTAPGTAHARQPAGAMLAKAEHRVLVQHQVLGLGGLGWRLGQRGFDAPGDRIQGHVQLGHESLSHHGSQPPVKRLMPGRRADHDGSTGGGVERRAPTRRRPRSDRSGRARASCRP